MTPPDPVGVDALALAEKLKKFGTELREISAHDGMKLASRPWRDGGLMIKAAATLRTLAARNAELEGAIRGIADDYMTSEHHHPGYVLIPAPKFEALQALTLAAQEALLGQDKDPTP